ncbi:MAG: hypothetical protein WKF60_13745, partial [Ilumatobacter sp.]
PSVVPGFDDHGGRRGVGDLTSVVETDDHRTLRDEANMACRQVEVPVISLISSLQRHPAG